MALVASTNDDLDDLDDLDGATPAGNGSTRLPPAREQRVAEGVDVDLADQLADYVERRAASGSSRTHDLPMSSFLAASASDFSNHARISRIAGARHQIHRHVVLLRRERGETACLL